MNPNLKLLLRDFKLSDDISLRFSNSEWNEYPLFADKYINWIDALPQEEQVINVFMELSALGMAQPLSSNILEFLKLFHTVPRKRGLLLHTDGNRYQTEICFPVGCSIPDVLGGRRKRYQLLAG